MIFKLFFKKIRLFRRIWLIVLLKTLLCFAAKHKSYSHKKLKENIERKFKKDSKTAFFSLISQQFNCRTARDYF